MNQLSENSLQDIALMLKALGDPTRLKIMQYLHDGEQCVGSIVLHVGTGQANISKHLQVLARANLLKFRRQGALTYYGVYGPFVTHLCESICRGYEKITAKKFKEISSQK